MSKVSYFLLARKFYNGYYFKIRYGIITFRADKNKVQHNLEVGLLP